MNELRIEIKGLNQFETKNFSDYLVKANKIQLEHMLIMLQNEITSRYKRGLMR